MLLVAYLSRKVSITEEMKTISTTCQRTTITDAPRSKQTQQRTSTSHTITSHENEGEGKEKM